MYPIALLMQAYEEKLRAALTEAGVTGYTLKLEANKENVCGTLVLGNGRVVELPKVSRQNELTIWVSHTVLRIVRIQGAIYNVSY